MDRLRSKWMRVVVVMTILVGGVFVFDELSKAPLLPQLVRVGVNMPPLKGSVIGWVDSNTILATYGNFYTVDIRTGRRNDHAGLNRYKDLPWASGFKPRLSPDGRWLLCSSYTERVAARIDGSKIVVFPDRTLMNAYAPSSSWLPDSSGILVETEVSPIQRALRLYRLNRPEEYQQLQTSDLPSSFYLTGDVANGKVYYLRRDWLHYFDPSHLEKPPVPTRFGLPTFSDRSHDHVTWSHVDSAGERIVYGIERPRTLPSGMAALQKWFPKAGIRDPLSVREVWVADLKGRRNVMVARDTDGVLSYFGFTGRKSEDVPGWQSVGWLPDGRPGFFYKEALYAFPLPPVFTRRTGRN